MSSKKILKAVSIISIGTIISRIFGLFREITSANFFGTTFIYDAFLIAFMIPNFFRGIVAEGALNSAFIPVFTEYTTDGEKKKEANKVINLCFTSSIIITLSLLFIIYILSSFIPHFLSLQSKWFWVWTLLKFTFPYLIFISLTSLNMGILNVHKKFLLPSFSPIILDIFWIGSLFLLLPLFGNSLNERIFGLCFGIIGGGLFQFLYLLPIIKKIGYSYKLDFNFSHPAIRKMGRLILPVVAGVAVVPVNLLVDYSLAGTLFNGAVSGLWYATRIFQLPLGVFAISISTASLPYFSENIVTKNFEQFKENFYFAMKLLFFIL
ncbi:murein biosynthesis integral membrane protein MurJ, partial [bacterium]|nr:murein biosynthesis integral membrane protein MurJ [bacterium]